MAVQIYAPQGHVDVTSPGASTVSVLGKTYTVDITSTASSGGGTKDYEKLKNKPRIEDVELVGNKELGDFGMNLASEYDIAMLFR